MTAAGGGFAGGLAAAPGGGIGLKGPRRRGRGRRRWTFDRISMFVVFLGVPLAIFVVFVISPFVQAIFYSFTNWNGFSSAFDFIGLGNFQKLLGDNVALTAFFNNVVLALVVPFVTVVIALAFASAITVAGPSVGPVRGIRGSSFYRVVSFFPYAVPAIVIGIIWAGVFDPSHGILNAVLTGLGLPFQSFAWLGEAQTARWCLVFIMVWAFVGFYMVLFVAAVKGVPAETFEAARLDGAGRFRMTMSITIPSIRDNIQTAYIYLGITSLDAYVYSAGLIGAGGGPEYSTLTVPQRILQNLFTNGQASYASAMGFALSIVTLLFAVVVFAIARLARGRSDEGRR